MNYKQCECCGHYFSINEDNKNKAYCSAECEALFVRCIICNNYDEYEDGMDKNNYICCENYSKTYKLNKPGIYNTKLDLSDLISL